MAYKPRIAVRIVWNTEFTQGGELARHVYSRLCRNVEQPAARGLGLPVYFHRGSTPANAHLPDALALDAADSTVVVVLLDTSIRADHAWRECVKDLEKQMAAHGHQHLFLPIACEDGVLSTVNKANCVRLYKFEVDDRPDRLVSALTHELARLILGKGGEVQTQGFGSLEKSYAPVKLFISHSKHDSEGLVIATQLRDYGRQHLPVATFYDSNDIAAGSDFEKEIKANVSDSAMVVVHTNVYSDRAWCRKEVLFAKQYGCPVLVVNAVTLGEDRLFPYLGNAPTVSWPFGSAHGGESARGCQLVMDAALREVLKNAYFLEHVRTLKLAELLPKDCVVVGGAPEMLTYHNLLRAKQCDRAKPSVLLYPDPPLGDEEIDVLEEINPSNIVFTTPTTIAINSATPNAQPFKDCLIGISISNCEDLPERGMSSEHLEDAMVEIARHLLTQGASLAYGGDLRPGGFTTVLFELVRSHNRAGNRHRIHNFLTWPVHLRLDPAPWKEYLDESLTHKISPPTDLGVDPNVFLEPTDAAGRYAWARSLSAMRLEMNGKIQARILLGGQITGFKGKYPGLFEEALCALRSDKSLFVVGGFGGCASLIAETLKGGTPEGLTEAFQVRADPLFQALDKRYRADPGANKTAPIDYAHEIHFVHAKGVGGLNNGLSNAENEILFSSRHLPEIVHLVLKGLAQRFK